MVCVGSRGSAAKEAQHNSQPRAGGGNTKSRGAGAMLSASAQGKAGERCTRATCLLKVLERERRRLLRVARPSRVLHTHTSRFRAAEHSALGLTCDEPQRGAESIRIRTVARGRSRHCGGDGAKGTGLKAVAVRLQVALIHVELRRAGTVVLAGKFSGALAVIDG